jgi:AcrR family transcriptional regulator
MGKPSKGRRAPRKRSYHHNDLRRALMDAAVELVQEDDAVAMTLREVARRAGVTHAAPYHHFASKDALVAAIALDGYEKLYAMQVAAADAAGADAVERLRALGVAYVEFALAHPGHFRIMFRMGVADWTRDSRLAEAAQRSMLLVTDAVGQVVQTQDLEMDPMEMTLAAWSVAHGLATLWVDGPLRRTQIFGEERNVSALARRVINASTEPLRARMRGRGRPEGDDEG